MKPDRSGSALLLVVVILAVAAGGTWLFKPALFPGESKRAADSAKTTERLISATDRQGATVAASLVKIAEANAETTPTPQKSFIAQESALALTLLPPANATALIEAERRKTAVLEGQVQEARRLYELAAKTAAQLQHERDDAISAKRSADDALQLAAAAHHAQTVQLVGVIAFAIVAIGLWLWAKWHGVGPAVLGRLKHDLQSGMDLHHAFDAAIPQRLYGKVAKHRKLAAP